MYDFQIRCGALYFCVKNNATHHVHAYVHTKVIFYEPIKKSSSRLEKSWVNLMMVFFFSRKIDQISMVVISLSKLEATNLLTDQM